MAYDERGRYVEEKEDGSALGSAVKLGSILSAGALGFKYRKQIGRGIGKAFDAGVAAGARGASALAARTGAKDAAGTMGTILKSLDEATDMGIMSAMRNPARFERRFEDAAIRNIEGRVRQSRTPLGGEATEIENHLFDMRKNFKRGEQMHIQALRYQKVVDDMKEFSPDLWENSLQHIMPNIGNRDFFNAPTKGKVKGFVEQYSQENARQSGFAHSLTFQNDQERKKFEKAMFESLERYKDARLLDKKKVRGGVDQDGVDHGYGVRGVRKDQMDAFKEQNSKEAKETWLSKVLGRQGYRQMTVKDALSYKGGKNSNSIFDSDSRLSTKQDGSFIDARLGRKLELYAKQDESFLDLVVDSNLFINGKGEMLDYRGKAKGIDGFISGIRDNTQIPFLNFNPLDLMHWSTIKATKEAPKTYFLKRGTIDPNLAGAAKTVDHPMAHNQDATVGSLARDYMYTGDKVIDVATGDVIKDRVYLTSARFGMFPRMNAAMGNLHRQDYRNVPFWKKMFGAEGQENETIFSRAKSVLTKFDNPEWAPNAISAMARGEMEGATSAGALSAESTYKILYSELNEKTTKLSGETVDYINQFVKNAYGGVEVDLNKMNTAEEVMATLQKIRLGSADGNSDVYTSPNLSHLINNTWNQYERNPTEFLKNMRIKPDDKPYIPEAFSALDQSETQAISKLDDVQRLIHQHAIEQVEHVNRSANLTVADLVREGMDSGSLGSGALTEVRNLSNLNSMRKWWDDVYINGPIAKDEALYDFKNEVLFGDGSLRASLQTSMKEFSPNWAMGPGQEPPNYFGFVGFQTMTKAKGHRYAMEQYNKAVANGEDPLKAGVSAAMEVLGQPFAGRNNLDKVTTATAPFYYSMERLNNAVSQIGLGLAQKDLGSAQSIFMNMMAKRIIMPYAAYQQASWLDDQTGGFFSDKAADMYVNMHEDMGHFKEFTGINRMLRDLASVIPGTDQLVGNPIGGILKYGTFGLIGDTRSGDEIHKYYESGEDPIRKGRWWGVGSNTPWIGGKIDRWEPNWYRKMKSDYQYTDTMWGSQSEYWANNWMPTLNHPFAPIKHFLTDTKHWENKHREDRPYAISGGFGELDGVPIVGSILNSTIGKILKPQVVDSRLEKAHREYLTEINEYYVSQYGAGSDGAIMEYMPSGGYNILPTGVGSGPYDGNPGTVVAYNGDPAEGVTPGTIGNTGNIGAGAIDARKQLIAVNSAMVGAAKEGYPSFSSLESLRDPDMVAELKDIGTISSVSGTIRDTFYSMSEVMGIYGFGTKWLSGFEEGGRGWTLDPSSRMTSLSRSWWDMEMGGAGGMVSEIFRRFLPRDPNKKYYNPIRNTMPDWMPGIDYFTDFKHGDPYVKVKNGEMRLPGEAYETLHKLHPDAFGDYGAFDRFKILADVAPYSKEYKYYRRVISQMNQQGLLDEDMTAEYKEVRDQISQRKSKYLFYDRRFGNADTERETVTVTKVVDANTFITKEYGAANPLKLAGINIKSDDQETQDWLSQYIKPGATLDVELDADPLYRVRDDMMHTMRAVVYTNQNEEGNMWFTTNKGQNLNYMLANRSFGGKNNVTVKDDGSATSTKALWSDTGITVGKLMEFTMHDLLPNIPIIGTFADKFLQIRSPLEMYKKNEVFGKAWRPWEEPIEGWIEPMLQTMMSHNPVIAAGQGAGIGWLATRGRAGKKFGKYIGGIIGGGLATYRVFREQFSKVAGDGEDWIPERRKRERAINEYFDKLSYVKNKGLYEKARRMAIEEEGVDVEELIGKSDERGSKNKQDKKLYETVKKYLAMSKKMGYGEGDELEQQLKMIRERIKTIEGDRPLENIGPMALMAMRYRAEMESTLYGADPSGDMTKIFRALPAKDREYFTQFMQAAPEDREEILRLVPKDQRRFYQAKWGLELDKKEDLNSYFKDHYLPDEDWVGWEAGMSLDNIKVKVVQNEGIELTEFGLWGDDVKRSEDSGAEAISMGSTVGQHIDVGRLEKVLRGAGLEDVRVNMTRATHDGESAIDVGFNIMKDRTNDIVREINTNIGSIFS